MIVELPLLDDDRLKCEECGHIITGNDLDPPSLSHTAYCILDGEEINRVLCYNCVEEER